jgi:diadenylate cyclase
MPYWTLPLLPDYPKLTPRELVDVLVTAFLIYLFLRVLRGRRAWSVLAGVGVMLLIYAASVLLQLQVLETVLSAVAPYSVFGLIVMFNTELRMALARLGQPGWFSSGSRLKRREFAEEILLALEMMVSRKVGALIVIERDIGLRTFVESGVPMEAIISRDLLLAIFHPNAALHDGGVIVQNGKIAAAACFLPLSANPKLMNSTGTRHRAGLGITEDTDCLSLIVSEETGQLSVAAFDELERDLTLEQVRHRLERHFGWSGPRAERKDRAPSAQTTQSVAMPLVGDTAKPVGEGDRA